jgi:hypothetical protein
MATAYQKRRNKDRKHAALMKRDPSLREQLYGPPIAVEGKREGSPPDRKAGSRETAHKERNDG